jgi:hypothetical protein
MVLKLSIYEFARLTLVEKADLITNQGVFLENLGDSGNEINLYYFNGFFVEVEVNKLQNMIVEIIPFKQGYKVKKYLDKINLEPQ